MPMTCQRVLHVRACFQAGAPCCKGRTAATVCRVPHTNCPSVYLTPSWGAVCAVYVFVSYRLFLLTDALRHMVIPDKVPGTTLIRNAGRAPS